MAERTCSIPECSGRVLARGMCNKHYIRWRKHGDPAQTQRRPAGPCRVVGCETEGDGGHGWCAKHYRRYYRRGDPKATSRIVGDDAARFDQYTDRNGPLPPHRPELGPCWTWIGYRNADGYGVMGVTWMATNSAHRWAYLHHVGTIPVGLELDHLCRNRACVNPGHLEPVTHLENLRRAREAQRGDQPRDAAAS